MLDLPELQAVLSDVFKHIEPAYAQAEYRIVGTAAALLHGVCLPAGDIDVLLKTRAGVDAFSASLPSSKRLTPPRLLDGGVQYFASFEIGGVKVEFSTVEWPTDSDTHECMGSGPWTHYTMLPLGDRQVPAVNLELRFITEVARRRKDRYMPIWESMQTRGYDRDLVLRGLKERQVPESDFTELSSLWENCSKQCRKE